MTFKLKISLMLISLLSGLLVFGSIVAYMSYSVSRLDDINHAILEMKYLATEMEYNKERFVNEGDRKYSNAVYLAYNHIIQNQALIDFTIFEESEKQYMLSLINETDTYDDTFSELESNLSQIDAIQIKLDEQIEKFAILLQELLIEEVNGEGGNISRDAADDLRLLFEQFQIKYLKYNGKREDPSIALESISTLQEAVEKIADISNSEQNSIKQVQLKILIKSIQENFTKYATEIRSLKLISERLSYKSLLVQNIISKMVIRYEAYNVEKLKQVRYGLTILLSLIFLASCAIAFYLRRLVTGNLKKVVDATQKIAQGDVHTRLENHHNDEFGELSESINHMAASLEVSAIEMKNLNEQLELRVEQRTNELNQATHKLELLNQQLIAEKARLVEIASTDELTGLMNRRAIIRHLEESIKVNIRYQVPLSIMIVDIDHFKNINDQYGHIAGDDVLKRLSLIFMSSIRDVDFVGRFGGEEFLFVFQNTTLEDTIHLVERMKEEVYKTSFTRLQIKLTFSGGIAQYEEGTSMDLIHVADKRLYLAKEQGRNRIVYE